VLSGVAEPTPRIIAHPHPNHQAKRDERIREEAKALEREAAEKVRRLRAAVKIQAVWRGLKARRQVRQGGKAGGEKKGKGKKGAK